MRKKTMINEKIQEALNRQLNRELYSAYLYLSMAAYCQSINLAGFAHWFEVQSKEEVDHAMRFYKHVVERMGRVLLSAIETPPAKWASPTEIFEQAYSHEKAVTGMIDDIVTLARSEKDHATDVFLQWFINEQVEEEANADQILQQLKLAGDKGQTLLMMDRELAKRKTE